MASQRVMALVRVTVLLLVAAVTSTSGLAGEVHVAVAANFAAPMKSLATAF